MGLIEAANSHEGNEITKTNETTEQATHAATDAITLSGGDEALAKLRATFDAIPAHAVTPFRAQVPEAVAAIIQNAQSCAADRARFVATFAAAAFDPAAHDNLVVRAQALWQADLLYRRSSTLSARDKDTSTPPTIWLRSPASSRRTGVAQSVAPKSRKPTSRRRKTSR
ncbi:MAG: hypothetical protein HYY84_18950 [Deltaproteobacteria bacterium]|nr:hypothetical protein [Deltaproteobacteria bacterium]